MDGKIKHLNMEKKYGFIKCDDGKEYFFHKSALVDCEFDELKQGVAVMFEIVDSPKGPRAEGIELAI